MGGRQGYTGYVRANTWDCPSLSVNSLAKAGAFKRPCRFTINFTCGSEMGAEYDGSVYLNLNDAEQQVEIESQSRHFGGFQYFFRCPRCTCRYAKLYWGNDGFYCRKCYRLVYRSQQCGDLEWALSKQRKIEHKLDGKMRKTKRAALEAEFYEMDKIAVWHLVTGLQHITGKF